MKRIILIAACTTIGACSAHLPSTDVSELDASRAAIQEARDAGAEKCAPSELAKAEVDQLLAAHELDEGSSYNAGEAADLIASSEAAAKAAKAKCSEKPKNIVKAKPMPVVVAVPKPLPVSEPVVVVAPKSKTKAVKAEVIALDGVFFENNSAKLTSASTATLDKAVDALKQRPDIKVEVAAYTDSRGKASYNEYLSGIRANSVKDYLVSHGIDVSRVTAKGYGEASPIADNATKEGRAQNRRVELIIQ
jgi:outer membrane protein OmpA-like peptidoglycan-associated protein